VRGEFGPASFKDDLAAHLLDAQLPLAASCGIHNHLSWDRAKIRPEGVSEWQRTDARRHEDLAEVRWGDVVMEVAYRWWPSPWLFAGSLFGSYLHMHSKT
jgi:hypothetical protein